MSLIHCLFGKCKTSSLKYLFSNILIRIGHFELLLNIFYFVFVVPEQKGSLSQEQETCGIR